MLTPFKTKRTHRSSKICTNVCDASIEQYMYLSNNLIITVDTKCYSEWPEGMDTSYMCEPDLDAWRWEESYRQEVIDLMRATF